MLGVLEVRVLSVTPDDAQGPTAEGVAGLDHEPDQALGNVDLLSGSPRSQHTADLQIGLGGQAIVLDEGESAVRPRGAVQHDIAGSFGGFAKRLPAEVERFFWGI